MTSSPMVRAPASNEAWFTKPGAAFPPSKMRLRSLGASGRLGVVDEVVPASAGNASVRRSTKFTCSAISSLVTIVRSEEHTSELQSLMRISYAVFCLKKKKKHIHQTTQS